MGTGSNPVCRDRGRRSPISGKGREGVGRAWQKLLESPAFGTLQWSAAKDYALPC